MLQPGRSMESLALPWCSTSPSEFRPELEMDRGRPQMFLDLFKSASDQGQGELHVHQLPEDRFQASTGQDGRPLALFIFCPREIIEHVPTIWLLLKHFCLNVRCPCHFKFREAESARDFRMNENDRTSKQESTSPEEVVCLLYLTQDLLTCRRRCLRFRRGLNLGTTSPFFGMSPMNARNAGAMILVFLDKIYHWHAI